MKKIILSVAALSTALAQAQVGINQETPKATLDISVKTANKTTDSQEGLLIPRVTKEKALKMANNSTTPPEESALIYVNDMTLTGTADATVEDITENGYYFWNGTKWVKSSSANGEEWVYDDATKQINLKRSGQDVGFVNKVFYNEDGLFKNYVSDSYQYWDKVTKTYETFDVLTNAKYNYLQRKSSNLDYVVEGNKFLDRKQLIIDKNNDGVSNKNIAVSSVDLITEKINDSDYSSLTGEVITIDHQGSGNIPNIMGLSSFVSLRNGSTSQSGFPYITGLRSSVSLSDNSSADTTSGLISFNIARGSGEIGTMVGTLNIFSLVGESSSNITDITGVEIRPISYTNNTSQVENVRGFYYAPVWKKYTTTNTTVIENEYGVYLEDINKGTNLNYAIYTKKGNIRFGDLKGTGDRLVIANNEGVLSTSTASVDDFVSLWANDDTAGLVKLKATSNGTPRLNTPAGSRNDVTIDDYGKITAKAFIGYNGATIFPDYVFEKYYTGESTIKADYNFHNLASVESFIKTNGHLPGYQSAKEIASKGLIDLGATQLTNVEKIEELYLHTIEQDKALKAKDAKIEKLENELQAQKVYFENRLNKLEALLSK